MAKAGDVVGGKYRLIHPLGIGGMGTVWRAEHKDLKQHVAIKLLDARGPKAERAVRRFQREAQIAASIHHRNIVYISDFGSGHGEPYLVMELLSGVPLSERMVVGDPLSVGAFLHLMEETLQGLAAVHAAGVVHRDMKPENIFLVREPDGTLFPKLLDFGVSRSTERNQGHTITREGIVMGTPEYVSPEQARGRAADVRSDIYSLGVVIYEALAGRLPFQADNPADLIVSVLNAHPMPLSTFRPDLGDLLSALVSKAIARDPEARFQSADEMRAAISNVLVAQPELEDAMLPRRFHAPRTSVNDGELARDSMLPTTQGFAVTRGRLAVETLRRVLVDPERAGRRYAVFAAAAGALLIGLFAFAFGGDKAGGSSRAAAAAPAPVAKATTQTSPQVPVEIPKLEPPPQVQVELFGVPQDAVVRVNGAETSGNVLHMPRDSGLYEIEVEAKGLRPFRITHDAARDGRYAVSMTPLPAKAARVKAAPQRAAPQGGLLRRPDF